MVEPLGIEPSLWGFQPHVRTSYTKVPWMDEWESNPRTPVLQTEPLTTSVSSSLASAEGIEPSPADLESVMQPLHHTDVLPQAGIEPTPSDLQSDVTAV